MWVCRATSELRPEKQLPTVDLGGFKDGRPSAAAAGSWGGRHIPELAGAVSQVLRTAPVLSSSDHRTTASASLVTLQ